MLLYLWPVVDLPLDELDSVVRMLAPRTEALGLEQVGVQFRTPGPDGGEPIERLLRLSRPPGAGLTVQVTEPPAAPLRELDAYAQKVIRARRRGAVYPYELVPDAAAQPGPGRRARHVHRVRPGRVGNAGAGGPGAGRQHREPGARHGHHADAALPGGHDAASC